MIEKRNIVTCIILSIITCGIYGIYWFVVMTDDVAKVTGDNTITGAKAFLFTLITCGIYGYYWAYKMGRNLFDYSNKYNLNIADNSMIYIILQIFGLSIVNYCLIQNDLNTLADRVQQ